NGVVEERGDQHRGQQAGDAAHCDQEQHHPDQVGGGLGHRCAACPGAASTLKSTRSGGPSPYCAPSARTKMRADATPSAISALRTAIARDNEIRLAVEGSSGVPGAYAWTLNVVASPGGAAAASSLIDVALSGLRSDCPGAKVRRSPARVGAAVVAALSDTGG